MKQHLRCWKSAKNEEPNSGDHSLQAVASLMIITDHYQIVIVAKKIEEKWRNKSDVFNQIIYHHLLVLQYYDQHHLTVPKHQSPAPQFERRFAVGDVGVGREHAEKRMLEWQAVWRRERSGRELLPLLINFFFLSSGLTKCIVSY